MAVIPKRALTEAALRLLSGIRSDSFDPRPNASRPRILFGPFGPNDRDEMRRHSLLLRIVSIAEAYIDALFLELLGEQIDNPTDFLVRLMAEIEEAASSDWSSRIEHFKRLHEFSLQSCNSWQKVNAAIDVRNSIAHALGALTSRLRKKSGLAQNLRSIDATVGGGRIHLTDGTVEIVSEACRDLILEIDRNV